MGSVGDITITPQDFKPCMCNRALAIVRDVKEISPQYLFAYLLSNYATDTIERLKNGGVQQRINLDVLGEIQIPIFSKEFQDKIEQLVLIAQRKRQQSNQYFEEIDEILQAELGLKNWDIIDNYNVKKFNQSFSDTGRLDAEFHHAKYDKLLNLIANHNPMSLSSVSKSIPGFAFSSKDYLSKGIQLVRIQNVSGSLLDLKRNPVYLDSESIEADSPYLVREGDVLMAMTGATIGKCSLNNSKEPLLLNQRVLAIRSNEALVIPEYLNAILSSNFFQSLIIRASVGGAQPNISQTMIESQTIPVLDMEIQLKIKSITQKGLFEKDIAHSIIQEVKVTIDKAILVGEEISLNELEKELNNIGIDLTNLKDA